MTTTMDKAKAVADAVLYEGYLLYPYRASSAKNKVRWQWGVLMPPAYAASGTGEYSGSRTELLAEPGDDATLHVRLRFLQLQERIVEDAGGVVVPSLRAGGTEYTTWEEAVEREVDAILPFGTLAAGEHTIPFTVDGGEEVEPLPGGARLVRRRASLVGEIRLCGDALSGPYGGMRLRLLVENTSSWDQSPANRNDALRHALIAAHSLLSVSTGSFLSLLDPPQWAQPAIDECVNERAWPVLVGDPSTVLCSPIILYDYPTIADESAGNLFDGTEIDEILTLRTMTLTDDEKRAARATDPLAAELIDRVDHLPPELLDRLHGTVRYLKSATQSTAHPHPTPLSTPHPKPDHPPIPAGRMDVGSPPGSGGGYPHSGAEAPWWDPGADASVSPETDRVVVGGVSVGRGSRVRLRPNRRADAHDMFIDGRTAVVQAVLLDVDGDWHLAVTLEDDIGSELFAAHGRYRYFATDEVEPL
jgi:hypothetical protein